jgi:hypothetical protein
MSAMFRRFLILLLIITLPAQAVAGMLGMGCRHGQGGAAPLPASVSASAATAMQAVADDCPMHHGAHTAQVSAAPDLPAGDAAGVAHHPLACDDCGTCHSVGFSLLAPGVALALPELAPVRVAHIPHLPLREATERLDRPPRSPRV